MAAVGIYTCACFHVYRLSCSKHIRWPWGLLTIRWCFRRTTIHRTWSTLLYHHLCTRINVSVLLSSAMIMYLLMCLNTVAQMMPATYRPYSSSTLVSTTMLNECIQVCMFVCLFVVVDTSFRCVLRCGLYECHRPTAIDEWFFS